MTTKTTIKLKKILAVVLAILLMMGTLPITALAADPMQVTFTSREPSGIPLGDYYVDFTEGNFPFAYEAEEGQENLIFSQNVTITSQGGLVAETPPTPPDPQPPDEDEPQDGDYNSDAYNSGGYPSDSDSNANDNSHTDGGESTAIPEEYPPTVEVGYTGSSDTYGYEATQQTDGETTPYTPPEPTDPETTDELGNSVALVWYLDGERRTDNGTFSTSTDVNWVSGVPVQMNLRFDEVTAADMGVWTLRAYSYGQWVESPYALFLQVGEAAPLAAVMPFVDHTWNGNGNLITDIQDGQTITITTGASGTLTIPENANVTIAGGTLTEPVPLTGSMHIIIAIPQTSTVHWVAHTARGAGTMQNLQLQGNGAFELIGSVTHQGGSAAIANTSSAVYVTVNGGIIRNTGNGGGINSDGSLTLSSGEITSFNSWAINLWDVGGNIQINGGTISGVYSIRHEGAAANRNIAISGEVNISGAFGRTAGTDPRTITINNIGNVIVHVGETITIHESLTLINNGIITNNGTIQNYGTIDSANGIIINNGVIQGNHPILPPAFPGEGTSASPFLISTADDLALLATLVNEGNATYNAAYFRLENNIDLSVFPNWTPIGNVAANPFRGTFDGGNHTVSNMTINNATSNFQGLFGIIQNGTVRNIRVSGTINSPAASNVGGLAGRLYGGLIENAHADVNITSLLMTGGLLGQFWPGDATSNIVRASSATGNITATGASGGLVGNASGAMILIENSFATGNVTGTGGANGSLGGLVGTLISGATVRNCFATGSVSQTDGTVEFNVGGLVGNANGGNILNSAALNPSVDAIVNTSTVTPNVGRVIGIGVAGGGANLTSNIAFSGMTGNFTDNPATNSGATHRNGESVTANWIHENGALGGRFPSPPWTTANGYLPGLGGTTQPMPSHIVPEVRSISLSVNNNPLASGGTVYLGYAVFGYTSIAPFEQAITITNTGNVHTGQLEFSQVTQFPAPINLVYQSHPGLNPGVSSPILRVEPTLGLGVGTHTNTFNITATGISASFVASFTVTRATPTTSHIQVVDFPRSVGWTGSPQAVVVNPVGIGVNGLGTITVEYANTATPNIWTATAPSDVGTYNVRVNIAQSANFYAATIPLTGNLTITGVPMTNVTAPPVNVVFDGMAHGLVVNNGGSGTVTFRDTSGNYTLSASPTITNVADSPLTVHFRVERAGTGYNPFYGSATVTITQRPLTGATVTVSGTHSFTGAPIIPTAAQVTVTAIPGFTGTPTFTISATNNLDAGNATVTVTGAGNFGGTAQGTFSIGQASAPAGVPQTLYVLQNYATTHSFNLLDLVPNVPRINIGRQFYIENVTDTDDVLSAVPSGIVTSPMPIQIGEADSGQEATITIRISSQNYEDFNAVITVEVVDSVPVAGIAITGGNISIQVGQTQQLYVTITPAHATNQNVTWSSSNPAIAAVNNAGLVTAAAPGNATITATSEDGGRTAAVTVTVTAVPPTPPSEPEPTPTPPTPTPPPPPTPQDPWWPWQPTPQDPWQPTPTPTPTTAPEAPTAPVLPTIRVNDILMTFTEQNGIATLNLPAVTVARIINATQTGNLNDTVLIDLSDVSNITSTQIPTAALALFANAGFDVEIRLQQGTITFDAEAAASTAEQAEETIKITLNHIEISTLTNAEQYEVSDSDDALFHIAISSGTERIRSFDGLVTVTTHFSGELPVGVWYLNEDGEIATKESTFNAATGTVTFSTDNLSVYAIGFDGGSETDGQPTEAPPTDSDWVNPLAKIKYADWFFESLRYLDMENLLDEEQDDTFAPNVPVTRSKLVKVLFLMAGEPSTDNLPNDFEDVTYGAWYENAVRWAAASGIVLGTDDYEFAPGNNITREQMAVMLFNLAEYMGITLPQVRTGRFADNMSISAEARQAVNAMFEAGIISGDDDNVFNPQGNTTRAEMAEMLRNFIKAASA